MLTYLKQETQQTVTENGAAAYQTTGSACLDVFATIGAMRHKSELDIITRFHRALKEDSSLAMKLLFYARDIRGGLGERRTFRILLHWLAKCEPQTVQKNLPLIAEYGRYDDYLVLFDTPCQEAMLAHLRQQYEADQKAMAEGEPISLLAKWLPSVNASNRHTVMMGKRLAKAFGQKEVQYRKTLSALRRYLDLLENRLRQRDYTFSYEQQPSRAMLFYRQAFWRNDEKRYSQYLEQVQQGKAVLHTDGVAPYELVEPYLRDYSKLRNLSKQEAATLNTTWASFPDFGGDENAIAVVDTSGSMYCAMRPMPASVALSLGIYFAQRNQGVFHNHFIEFSKYPKLLEIKGDTFVEQLRYITTYSQVANTNVEAVFQLILRTAINHKLPQSQMPTKLILISDMEFDCCVNNASQTVFHAAKNSYEAAGYKLPQLVFWNVASRHGHQPVTQNEQGVVLVSGASPALFEMVAGGPLSPYQFMLDVLNSPRYEAVVA